MTAQPLGTLKDQIGNLLAQFSKGPGNPDATAAQGKVMEDLIKSNATRNALQTGMPAPDFGLPDVDGNIVKLSELLQKGPVVVTFYRGDWCPFCNLTLRAYQAILPQIQAAGASLVAISPQTPDYSVLTAQHKELTYPVLSDVGSNVARSYGLVYTVPEEVRPYSANLPEFNGTGAWELPMPGTFVIDRSGKTTLAFVNPNFMQRLEPSAILEALSSLSGS